MGPFSFFPFPYRATPHIFYARLFFSFSAEGKLNESCLLNLVGGKRGVENDVGEGLGARLMVLHKGGEGRNCRSSGQLPTPGPHKLNEGCVRPPSLPAGNINYCLLFRIIKGTPETINFLCHNVASRRINRGTGDRGAGWPGAWLVCAGTFCP